MREDDLIDVSGFSFEPPYEERKPRDYRFPPAEAWLHAERSYADGEPADLICRAYGLSLSTFRTRARREGWRRKDMAEVEICDPISLEPAPASPPAEMADLAWRSAAEAIRRGKVYEARAWMRLAAELKTLAKHEATEARVAAVKAAAETATPAPELHSLHPERGVQRAPSHAETLPNSAHPGEGRDPDHKELSAGNVGALKSQKIEPYNLGPGLRRDERFKGRLVEGPLPDEPPMKPVWQMFKENPNDFSG